MTEVEKVADALDCGKAKSATLGGDLLKKSPLQRKKPRSHSTAPHFPSSLSPPKANKDKAHHSDDENENDKSLVDEEDALTSEQDVEDGGEDEKVSSSLSSSSSSISLSEDDEDEGGEEKEGRCYAFDTLATSSEISFVDEEDGEEEEGEEEHTMDEEDDDDDTTTEGTEPTFGNEGSDDEDDDHSERTTKASAFEINAVTGVVAAGRPRGVSKLKLPLAGSQSGGAGGDAGEPLASPRGFVPSPRGYYSPRPMLMPMTPHKSAALAASSRERVCDVEHVIEENQRMVSAGSTAGLVDKLISIDEGVHDFDLHYFTSVFLITHPMFVPTAELLHRIFEIFDAPAAPFPGGADDPRVLQQRVKTRVLEVLKKWAEEFSNDFKAGCEARELLDNWIAKQTKEFTHTGEDPHGEESAHDQQSQLLKKIQALLSSNDLIQRHMVPVAPAPPPATMAHDNDPDKMNIPLPPPPPVDDLSRFCVLDFPPAKIAQQLTYIDFQMFSAVRFYEFYHCAWSKKECEKNAPNLVRLIERFNKVSQWIQTSIVRVRDLKKRTAVLARFIHIAQEFEWLHNFQGMMMVNAALNNSAISRLKHTWAALGDADRERFDSIQNFFTPYHNYQFYRQKLRTSVPPIVPFMALFLTDLTFIDENEDKVARKKADAEAAEQDAKESHDDRASASKEDLPSSSSSSSSDSSDSSDAANANNVNAGEGEVSSSTSAEEGARELLVNFQKMELVGKVLLNIKKFQKATYKNLIPSSPFQKFFGDIVEEAVPTPEEVAREKKKEDLYADKCFMWSLDAIYKFSLVIEPRDGKPPKTKASKPKKRASATAPASLESSPVKPKKETRKNSKKYATMGRSSKGKAPDTTLTIQQNPLLMQLQSRNLQKRTSRSGSIDNPSVTNSAIPSPPTNPLIAAAANAKKERSYSMPPIILEKSASLSALRKFRDEKDDDLVDHHHHRDESESRDHHHNTHKDHRLGGSMSERERKERKEKKEKKAGHKEKKEKKDKSGSGGGSKLVSSTHSSGKKKKKDATLLATTDN